MTASILISSDQDLRTDSFTVSPEQDSNNQGARVAKLSRDKAIAFPTDTLSLALTLHILNCFDFGFALFSWDCEKCGMLEKGAEND